ncbi:hypothetical protein OG468_08525 [Streptomyces zaomyceticus]|uniref:hypothetical protein n=1 Tax=Streptomyces zaomyceticus TaxID=68286 RepID=UPI00324A49D7
MASKTTRPINHSCGHHTDQDLSERPADRRAGFAEWLAKTGVLCAPSASLITT